MKARYASIAVAVALVFAVAGCGGSGSSGADPASVVPPGTPVFIEAKLKPEAKIAANVEALAKQIAGVDNLGQKIVSELESAVDPGQEPLDYGKEIEPWLGEKAAIYLEGYNGEEFQAGGAAIETTDSAAAEEFIEKRVKSVDEKAQKKSYEGVDYFVETEEEGKTFGVDGDFVLFGETEKAFREMVDAANGESLADQDNFTSAAANAPSGSLADVFVDIGGLIEEASGRIDAETQIGLEALGIEPSDATAELSAIPGTNQIEIDLATDVTGKHPQGGDASKLLETMPGGSFLALSSADFGKRLDESIQRLDARGIPGQLEPHELQSSLESAGIDLNKISGSIGDLGFFAQGNTRENAVGAVVLETEGSGEATNTVSNIGLLVRAAGVPGVTALSGNLTGFSVPGAGSLGKPLVVAAEGNRIVIGEPLAGALAGLKAGEGATLGQNPAFKEAKAALGEVPISAFVAGPAALQFARAVTSPAERAKVEELSPYLEKISYVAAGYDVADELTTAKLIVGLAK
jgi:hypothetical protein